MFTTQSIDLAMAPYTAVPSFIPLRVVTQRLSTTPTRQLPYIVSYLAATISECRKEFESLQADNRDGSETGVVIHKLKTQLFALLQDRSPEARFSAVILIKATIEVGGWSILQRVGPWVRELIAIIGVSALLFLDIYTARSNNACLGLPSSFHIVLCIL